MLSDTGITDLILIQSNQILAHLYQRKPTFESSDKKFFNPSILLLIQLALSLSSWLVSMQPHSSSLHFPHSITLTTPHALSHNALLHSVLLLSFHSDPSLLLQQVRARAHFTLSQSAASNSYIFSSSTGIRLVKVMSKTKPLHVQHFKKEIQGETVSSSHLVSVPSSLS